ncbi:MAG: DegT/DnrJ/EryC1/StrS family aminotransferase [Chlamydiota bacterium]|nr:DegT/DnrJ/EryC1/StrS family aminotransferase [Chlamydiota bacterium]
MEFIDLKKQYSNYKSEIDEAIHKVLDHGKYIMGPEITELEEALSTFVGRKHCLTVSSGTDSLLMALMALEIGPGDEVITTPFTWISTAEVIKLVGATPVFVDIDPETYLIDVEQAEAAITNKTKAIIPVDLYGHLADYVLLEKIAKKYGVAIIQDAAQSFGASQDSNKSCSQGTISSTSFFPAKPFGCYGDGGAVFTDDDELARKMRAIRTHGGEKRHHHTLVGINGRFDTMQAAVLLAKLPHFKAEVKLRQKIADRYTRGLDVCCKTPVVLQGNEHVFGLYTIRTDCRDILQEAFKEKGIPCAIYYPKCLHEQPVFEDLGYRYGDFPHAEQAALELLSLPMHPWLNEEDQDQVIDCVLNCLATASV